MPKKTLKGWEKSDLDLDKYLTEPCEIDEDLSLYIGECVPPQYLGGGLTQGGIVKDTKIQKMVSLSDII